MAGGRLYWVLRILLLILLLTIVVYPFIPRNSVVGVGRMDYPRLFQYSILHFNLSTHSITGESSVDPADAVHDLLRVLEYFRDSMPPGGSGGFLGALSRAYNAYWSLANASLYYYNASLMLNGSWSSILELLDYIRECRFNDAIGLWESGLDSNVSMIQDLIDEGNTLSTGIDPGALLSDDHRSVYAGGLDRVVGVDSDLRRLRQLMDFIKLHRGSLNAFCSSGSVNASQDLASSLQGLRSRFSSGSGGPLSYDLYSIVDKLYSRVAMGTGVGGGAGWGSPESDD